MLPLEILGIGATIAVAIFVIVFIYLTTKWAMKKTKEMARRFEVGERKKKKDD